MSDKFTDNQLFNLISGSRASGESTYDVWKSLGNEGDANDFLEYLKEGATDVSPETLAQIEQNKNDISQLSEQIVDHENDTTKHITSAERTKWNKNTTDIAALNETLANMQGRIVESVEEMTDTSKQYVLKSTGTIWEYKETTVSGTIREDITEGFTDSARWGSDGSPSISTSYADYVCTPKIDVGKYNVPFTLHLKGIPFYPAADDTYTFCCRWTLADGTFSRSKISQATYPWNALFHDHYVTAVIGNDETIEFTFTPPARNNAAINLGYVAFSAKGTSADAEVYITYEGETTTAQWVDTEVPFGSSSGSSIDTETLAKISELNNEGADPSTIKLLTKPVLDFYNASAYSDSDYTTSHLEKVTYPCRADIPIPFNVKWNHNEDAMRTTLVVDTKAIGTVNAYRMRIYDVTGFDNYPIYNLLPNTRYYYKVTHVLADGSLVEAKSGNFLTSSEPWRLLYIEGTQNVRDLGGWTGLDGKTVKYGKIIRGAALSDSSFNGLIVTDKGRLSLGELKIQAELNLGASDTETSIAANCSYQKIGYTNYATAITDATTKANFKTALEKIISWLSESTPRNVYFHCQGGCDRTATLSFQLLGLLGVSESDLAKEYELSSFSDIGIGRLRTTTKAVDTYDYVGMVEAIKAYSGDTITDKFYNFAIDCGISAETITAFRDLMLE